jgi:ornithine--oxo-acid transaminase
MTPDAIVLGKALGGGLMPVSLFLTRKEVMDVFTPGDHGSTFGGNPLAASVGVAALEVLIEENLITRAKEMGDYFQAQLSQISSPLIKEIRGKGLLIGVEIDPKVSAREICLRLLKEGVLCKETHQTVIRIAPPLIITKEQIDFVVKALQKVLLTY